MTQTLEDNEPGLPEARGGEDRPGAADSASGALPRVDAGDARSLDGERKRAGQMHGLAAASILVNASLSVEDIVNEVTEQARQIIGAHHAATRLIAAGGWADIQAISLSDKYAAWRDKFEQEGFEGDLPEAGEPSGRPPLRGRLAVPLTGRNGRDLGIIELSDKYEGDFDEQDEDILVQLAQVARVAIENARLYQEAQEAVLAREELLSVVSHDLKNPLSAIKGFAQMLRKRAHRLSGPEVELKQLHDGLTRINSAADKMSKLITLQLDIARLQAGRPIELQKTEVDLVALAREVAAEHRQRSASHVIRVEAQEERVVGLWDYMRLERALDNLVANAVKYSPEGGEVLIRVGLEPGGEGKGQSEGGDWAFVSVQDHGIGIPDDDLPHIFEWYRRARNVHGSIGGAGVGLASVEQVAEKHGGEITVQSHEAEGSTFTLRLPLEAPEDVFPS